MDKHLTNLNEKMNRTVLKNIRFEEKHKKNVMKSIQQSTGGRKNHVVWTRKANWGLSIGVSAALIFGITYYGGEKMGLFSTDKTPTQQADRNQTDPTPDPKETVLTSDLEEQPKDQKGNSPVKNGKESKSIYEPSKQKEYHGDMTTKEVMTKMYNSTDYFKTAKGKFEMMWKYSSKSVTTEVEFQISLGDPTGGYSKASSNSTNSQSTKYSFFKEGTVWDVFQDTKKYRKGTYTVGDDQSPPVGAAYATLIPYNTTLFFFKEYQSWKIEKQNEDLLGHNTIVITGDMNNLAAKKFKSKTLRLWVDKDSGILVQFETYDSSGEIVNYLHPTELQVNVPINTSLFEPNLEGYEEQGMPRPEFDPREQHVTQKAFAKGYDNDSFKAINSVLKNMRNEIQELYELKDPSLQLTLVDYEVYKEKIPQGGMIYVDKKSYNSGELPVKTIGIRFQQEKAYHKNDFVYVVSTGEIVDEFEVNGIKWTVRKDDRNIYYVGKKDDYTYEVVAEHYTLEEANELIKTFEPSN
ncbi:hypothetical protein [Alkalihalobacillus sp. AL-G]|uniref:hypothetical protein n=1 Tax=Alkalihalobacillus sp. AL-G TaxID=2926399 RepID=UPI00272A5E3F|nr:hypothetical protein [Alkalihalobacillus sp. AL-G]WLD94255.1 hypothetical protein MOJ78_05010 [Alkalihalobacillus sp. AL-G]